MEWNPDRPIKEFPEDIRESFVGEAEYLFNDLKSNKLTVVLAPAPEPKHCGHMIRVAESQNPRWYSDLYHSYEHFRRDRSLRALDRIRKSEDRIFRVSPYKYDSIYRQLIFGRLVDGYYADGFKIPPDNEVRKFFDMPLLEEILSER